MEIVISLAIGVLAASGVWLLLRPRSFQVIVGLCLLSYAVNLFIFAMGRLTPGAPAIMPRGGFINPTALQVCCKRNLTTRVNRKRRNGKEQTCKNNNAKVYKSQSSHCLTSLQ